jgi:hypothetical protein
MYYYEVGKLQTCDLKAAKKVATDTKQDLYGVEEDVRTGKKTKRLVMRNGEYVGGL